MLEGCVFCDLDESQILFRDDLVMAIWDQYPVNKGHLLIVAKRHVADWFDATSDEQQAFLAALNRGRDLIDKQHGTTAFNIGVNVGTAAGQTVPHLHMHLIPRFDGDMSDPRGGVRHVIPSRGNYLSVPASGQHLLQGPSQPSLLIRGEDDPLLPHFTTALDDATNADFAVAFVMTKGVELLRGHLYDLLERGGRVRIVTGDYLDATDPDALVQLLDLRGDLHLRVFESRSNKAFHPKAYIFHHGNANGMAFVGSSNLTGSALQGGVEWNYRVLRESADCGFADVANAFEDLFAQTRPVDQDWIDDYRRRRRPATSQRVVEVVDEPIVEPPKPHAVQLEALAALEATRQEGNEAGLVVLATGLGKTWLAAFDSSRNEFPRVLFVAHREEILNQAMRTFRRIRPYAKLGLYSGKQKSRDADVLFASIQTLGRMDHLRGFPRDRFDYIVVDEFHHAAARTYRQLLDYFTPRFLLGLTATPERMDGGDLLALCQENLVYRKDVVAGIEAGLLCPFQYFGVPDDVDYTNIPWRSSRFDEEELTKAVATTRRAGNALEQFRERGGDRGLGFCCSQRHANFMAEYFNENGVRSVAVHSGAGSSPRATTLEALEAGRLDIVFAVDMFNEGLDVPNVDTILMLRPTESSVIWMQQFGRGLRRAEGKLELKVIDYIGNHRTFLVKVRALLKPILGNGESDAEISAAMRLLQQGQADLPEGCNITYDLEAMDIIRSLLRTRSADDAILAFYDDFRERNGTRPTAVELYHSGYNPRSLRKTHGSWTKFLRTMGDLSDAEKQAVDSAGDVLGVVESTPMTKSFKMLTLQAMLNHDALPGRIKISDLATEFCRIARRTKILRTDVGNVLDDGSRLKSLLEKNPIEAWCGGKGIAGALVEGAALLRSVAGQTSGDLATTLGDYEFVRDLLCSAAVRPNRELCEPLALNMINRTNVYLSVKLGRDRGNPFRVADEDGYRRSRSNSLKRDAITRRELADLGNVNSRLVQSLIDYLQNADEGYARYLQMGCTGAPVPERNWKRVPARDLSRRLKGWSVKQVRTHFDRLQKRELVTAERERANGPLHYQFPEELENVGSPYSQLPTVRTLTQADTAV